MLHKMAFTTSAINRDIIKNTNNKCHVSSNYNVLHKSGLAKTHQTEL
jgi:hypothetical protein